MNDWTPNHGGNNQFKKKEHFGFDKDTSSITFRILPQPKGLKFGSPKYNNTPFNDTWHKYHSVIFGFKNMEGKHRIFESPLVRNNKTKMTDVPCAASDRINELRAKLEEARVTGNGAIQPKLNSLVGLKGVYSINNNQHMNVMLLDGTIGELKLKHKAFLQLKVEIDKLRAGSDKEVGFDPLSFNNGRFFTMTRNTLGRDTTFNVVVYKEQVEVPGHGKMDKTLVHTITPEILARLEKEGYDLNNIHLKVTSEECAQIVAESDLMSGKSPACNRIFDDKWKIEREARKANYEAAEALEQQEPEPDEPTVSTVIVTDVASRVSSVVTSPNAATAVPANVVQPVVEQVKAAVVENINDLPDDEWFKQLGVK